MVTTLISYLFGIINPVFSRFFMDWLLEGENRELLMPFLILLAGYLLSVRFVLRTDHDRLRQLIMFSLFPLLPPKNELNRHCPE